MSAGIPDVVIYCDDHHDEVAIQVLRWLATRGVWAPMVRRSREVPIYRGPFGDSSTPNEMRAHDPGPGDEFDDLFSPTVPAYRSDLDLRCTRCSRRVPVRAERLPTPLAWWLAEGYAPRIPLSLLPGLVSRFPPSSPISPL